MADPRAGLVDAMRRLAATGLNRGATGNVSLRDPAAQGLWITASGVPVETMGPEDIGLLGWDGTWQGAAGRKPSSEWRFHRDILAGRAELNAVVHAHPVACTALAVHGRGMGAFHYMIALAGGTDIRCARYALFGSQALSEAVLAALEGRRACLMAHHGMIACGVDMVAALTLAVEVEALAQSYLAACALGEPPLLSADEMTAVLEKFAAGAGYGSAPR